MAQAAIEAVVQQRKRRPLGLHDRKVGVHGRHGVLNDLLAGAGQIRHGNARAIAGSGFQQIHHVQIVGPGFGPVLPRVRGGIGADEVTAPVGVAQAFVIVALQGLRIVLTLIAKQGSEGLQISGVCYQLVPVKMTNFMAQMPYQRAIGLMQLKAPPGAFFIIGFHHVESDQTAGMTRHDV